MVVGELSNLMIALLLEEVDLSADSHIGLIAVEVYR